MLDTLRESASAKEYGDLVDQLPQEFWQLTGEVPRLATSDPSANVSSVARVIGSACPGGTFGRAATDWMNSV